MRLAHLQHRLFRRFLRAFLLCAVCFSMFGGVSTISAQQTPAPNPLNITNPLAPSNAGPISAIQQQVTPGTGGTRGTPGTGRTPGTPGTAGTPGTQAPGLSIQFNNGSQEDVGIALQLVMVMTVLTLAPSIIILMTSFTRIVIVLGFIRAAIGTQSAPANQIIIGMALILTFYIMGPTFEAIYQEGIQPYLAEEKTSLEALAIANEKMKGFMLTQTEPRNVDFFLGLSGLGPTTAADLPMRVVVPSFVLSELKTAFQMGFLIYVPFLVIDFLVASILMSMGMMMMPPVIIALPFKILLFVLVDGWYLIVSSLVRSF